VPRAVLVGVSFGRTRPDPEAAGEFQQLATSAGIEPAGELFARRERPDPAFYVGRGKVEEIKAFAGTERCELALFDANLSPVQQRNLERETGLPVLDRTGLILEIFAQRARSREGRLQVELAQLEYQATRLVRSWTHLERQRGGIGLRGGPGEKQIELDRRMIGVRVKQLREKLRILERQRGTQRRARMRGGVFRVSLVGYTNAGKSTLFNRLTHSDVYAADQLFATLDTTSRRISGPGGASIIMSDTVGFIRDLPHTLVAAFSATLEETVEADLLLHVVDAASPARDDQVAEVNKVLAEIGADCVPQVIVFNKIDAAGLQPDVERDQYGKIAAVRVSAKSGAGIEYLRSLLAELHETQRNAEGVVAA